MPSVTKVFAIACLFICVSVFGIELIYAHGTLSFETGNLQIVALPAGILSIVLFAVDAWWHKRKHSTLE